MPVSTVRRTALLLTAATATLGVAVPTAAQASRPPADGGGAVTGVTKTNPPNRLLVRKQPGRGAVIARLAPETRVAIRCQTSGPAVNGRFGRSRVWDQIATTAKGIGYVSDSYVFTGSDDLVAPVCGRKVSTGATKPGRIATERLPLIVRRAPNLSAGEVTRLAPGTRVRISCQTTGPAVAGTLGTSTLWNRITSPTTGFVPDSYVATGSDGRVAPPCRAASPPSTPAQPPEDQAPSPGGGPKPGQAEEGRCTSDVPFPLERAPANRGQFIDWYGDDASRSDRRTQVPAAVTLGQGILESGDGQHTAGANNYFGIKAASKGGDRYRWGDEAVGCVFRKTREVVNGQDVYVVAAFRLYRSATDSFVDHAEFLSESSRYRPAFGAKDDSREFVRRIQKAGYATDPKYSTLVIGLMDQNNLYRFDVR
ncbi:glucosaminidase domain-containing protein [Paraconexibacter algicola]|uniref:glucosaminidase domain-containing protein n=1 Tax=Paraconexibacter algicola TaxID=2133960 RepID=UPI001304F036|nr:glucosaminidase domain-containing protein [Paraconexibacter algicola]